MGIDVHVFDFLMGFRAPNLGRALCLGRQGFHLAPQTPQWAVGQDILARADPGRRLEDLVQPDGFCETFLAYLGCESVRSLDFSPFEGAQIVCDLNKPVPKGLWGQFDLIIDGGTLEHVFDVPAAIRNVKQLLSERGLFLSVNAANNQLGHGLYQFSPELFWRAFAPETGFAIEKMQLMPLTGVPSPYPLTDPAGQRQEIGPTPLATYLMVAARRVASANMEQPVYQSDYAAGWAAFPG